MILHDYFEYIAQWATTSYEKRQPRVWDMWSLMIWCTVISSLLIDGRRNKYAFHLLRCYLILIIYKRSKIDLPLSQRLFNFDPPSATLTKHFVNPGWTSVFACYTQTPPLDRNTQPVCVNTFSWHLFKPRANTEHDSMSIYFYLAYISHERDNSHWATVILRDT